MTAPPYSYINQPGLDPVVVEKLDALVPTITTFLRQAQEPYDLQVQRAVEATLATVIPLETWGPCASREDLRPPSALFSPLSERLLTDAGLFPARHVVLGGMLHLYGHDAWVARAVICLLPTAVFPTNTLVTVIKKLCAEPELLPVVENFAPVVLRLPGLLSAIVCNQVFLALDLL